MLLGLLKSSKRVAGPHIALASPTGEPPYLRLIASWKISGWKGADA